jgi:hypothetical protein
MYDTNRVNGQKDAINSHTFLLPFSFSKNLKEVNKNLKQVTKN